MSTVICKIILKKKPHSDCAHAHFEVNVKKMDLIFDRQNLCIFFFWKSSFLTICRIPMGTNCAPFFADLFLYSYETECIQKLVRQKNKSLARAFNSTFSYIDDVLSIKNSYFNN